MLLKATGYRAMPWRNGQGLTREIAREPAEGEAFLWRLSIAEVAASGEFSLFPDYDRTITLIEGRGMRLDFDEAPSHAIERPFEPFGFSGDWHCRCSLLGGPVRDFNLMVDRARAEARTEVIRLGGAPVDIEIEDGWLLVYCAEGRLANGSATAESGDTLQLGPARHRLSGSDALALVMKVRALPGHMLRGR
jgi:uncharacterized protein